MSTVRVRMAPSPTGFLHIGGVRTFLFNWLFARGQGGELLLRIENTDTSREVAEATDQIQESLRWLGIDWDGPVRFQLDTADKARELAHKLVAEGHAYEDDGAIRFRQPEEGVVSWDDAVRGHIEFQNEQLPDLVIVRSDGRPTYNFVSPVDDVFDEITHVIRGEDHVSNTPSQINILRALGADLPVYAHVPNINGDDGRKLSKRRQRGLARRLPRRGLPARCARQLPGAARLELRRQDDDHVAPRAVERFSLERVGPSPATLDYKKLDWMNGVYLRELQPDEYAHDLLPLAAANRGSTGRRRACTRRCRSCRRRSRGSRSTRTSSASCSSRSSRRTGSTRRSARAAAERLATVEPWEADRDRGGAARARRRAAARSRGRRSSRSGSR